MHYLESLDDSRQEPNNVKSISNSSGLIISSTNRNTTVSESTSTNLVSQKSPSDCDKLSKGSNKPSILQRKRKQKLPSDTNEQHSNLIEVK